MQEEEGAALTVRSRAWKAQAGARTETSEKGRRRGGSRGRGPSGRSEVRKGAFGVGRKQAAPTCGAGGRGWERKSALGGQEAARGGCVGERGDGDTVEVAWVCRTCVAM